MAALDEAGVEPEVFLPEYGRDQFEVSCGPALGEASADRAVAMREITREIARLNGLAATFAPKTSEDGVGNGVHLHLSFRDKNGAPALFDAGRPGRLSSLGARLLRGRAGPSPSDHCSHRAKRCLLLRLQPHHWSAAWTWLGERDREATLRICPTSSLGGASPAQQFNVEYRAADATACPHLVLAAVTRAGLEGVRAGLEAPPIVDTDPVGMSDDERGRLGLRRLPQSLQEALSIMASDKVVSGWFSATLLETYHGLKRRESRCLTGSRRGRCSIAISASTDGRSARKRCAFADNLVNADGAAPFVLVCEHASNYMPSRYGGLGLPEQELTRHIAWDVGAAELTRQLASRLDAVRASGRRVAFASRLQPAARLVDPHPRDQRNSDPGQQKYQQG